MGGGADWFWAGMARAGALAASVPDPIALQPLFRSPRAPHPPSLLPPLPQAVVAPRALSDVNIAISGATAASLFLGRFVFFEYQKKAATKAGLPKQNGKTHLEAGDRLAAESSVVSNSGDPAGFTIPLLLGWGALGHVAGYIALATASLSKAGFSALPY